MSKIIYVPLEHIPGRYTVHMDRDCETYLNQNSIDYVKVMPDLTTPPLPKGMFLNAPFTSRFKAQQLAEIAGMYERGEIHSGDRFFFSDIWFPGIESIAYMNYFTGVDAKITGVIHAGSFTDTDFVRDMERWAKNFEDIVFDISAEVYCASNFIRDDIIRKRMVDPQKLTVTGLPVDYEGLREFQGIPKKRQVVFNGRLCDEKQPWLFDELERQIHQRVGNDVTFIKTQEHNLSKPEYYRTLAESQVVVSYALQENFGFGIAEAAYLGCVPVLPNRLVYPELYSKEHLFDRFEQSVDMVAAALTTDNGGFTGIELPTTCFDTWFNKDTL
jgi:glycosyltransferase involved in cell wall biosynthesis